MIRVQIAATSAVVRAGLESLIASSPDLTVTDSYSDVVLAAVPLDELLPAPAIVLLGDAGVDHRQRCASACAPCCRRTRRPPKFSPRSKLRPRAWR